MAKHPLSKREEERQVTRRALIKWSVAAGAALGVSRAKIFEILERTAGKDVAFAASANPTTRSVHFNAANGGLAWLTQFWPWPAIANSTQAFAWNFPGQQKAVGGTDNPLVIGPVTPWATLPAASQMTCFTCGTNQTHTGTQGTAPSSTVTLNGANIWSVASALQSASPSVIPMIDVAGQDVGTAPGASAATGVTSGTGIVDLFNSAASRAGGLLAKATDASLYTAQYQAFTQLNRAANRSTTKISYTTATGAAGFLGTNLSAQLAITSADQMRYGLTTATRSNVQAIAETLIVAVKAFKMGLTNSVVLPFMLDDPHGAFDGGDINIVPQQIQAVLNGFMNDLQNTVDENTMENLADDTVISFHGDTYKDPTTTAGWPDGTPTNSNIVFVYGAGYLLSGWWGSVDSAGQNVTGFDVNGKPAAYNGPQQATSMAASIAYAIAKGDSRAISQFANGVNIAGIFGRVQQT